MSATDATMTVIIDGEERQRLIVGNEPTGNPTPELFDGEIIYSVMSSPVPTIVQGPWISEEKYTNEKFKLIQYVQIDEVVTEKVKSEVSEWPPSVIKAEFGGETFYYNLADCHKKS